jgi:small subunit ribosomal protein S6
VGVEPSVRRTDRSPEPRESAVRRTQALLSRRRRGRPSPKEVETALRAYEVMVILDPDLEERTVAPSLEQYLNNVVKKDGGTVEKVDVWGRRRLAYEIDKNAEAIYAVIELQAEPATVKELDRQLSLNESVLRTKVIRPDVH